MRLIVAILALMALVATPAAAAKRVALVIGNGAYAAVPALANPRADAEAMAAALRQLGFEVELGVDLDLREMRDIVQAFAQQLQGADVALFYYAGHGMQVYGKNYLLPVDAELTSLADLDFESVPAGLVLAQMERSPAVKIVILDACRNNPFEKQLTRAIGSSRAARALSRGLAPIETAGGTLVAYATDPGDVAADGEGQHSPFTAALLEHVAAPGVEINTMFARVRADVYRATDTQQRPWTETSIIGEFYMAPAAAEPPVAEAPAPAPGAPDPYGLDPRHIELALWNAAEAESMVEDYQEYLRQYPEGIFATIAGNRIAALQSAKADDPEAGAGPENGATAGSALAGDGGAGTVPPDERVDSGPADVPALAVGTESAGVGDTAGTGLVAQDGSAGATDEGSGLARRDDGVDGASGGTAGATGAATRANEDGVEIAALPPEPGLTRTGSGGSAPDAQAVAAAVEATLGLGRAERREVQVRLLLAGHDPQGADGIFGPDTRAALTAWQAAVGIEPTGYLDAAALARLERSTEAAYAARAEQHRREAEARREAAERARATQRDGQATVGNAPTRPAPPVATEPAPQLPPSPEATAEAPDEILSPPPEGWEIDCYFVASGSPHLERRCELVREPPFGLRQW